MSEEVAMAIHDIAYWQRRAEAAEADAAALRELYDDVQRWRESGGDVRELRYVLETADRVQSGAGEALLAELTAARLVVMMARRGFGSNADMARHKAFDPVALQGAIVAYDAERKEAGE
jgi:hypothetical protein